MSEQPYNSGLSDFERSTIGELGNIAMGAGATTLSMILNKQVQITAPVITETMLAQLMAEQPDPLVVVEVKYTVGEPYPNVFLLKASDASIICDLMMGGDGTTAGPEIGEMQLSAVGEAMNQMMGTAATSMSTFFGKRVDISPPASSFTTLDSAAGVQATLGDAPLVCITFDLNVEGLTRSKLYQLLPESSVQGLVNQLISAADAGDAPTELPPPVADAPSPAPAPEPAPAPAPAPAYESSPSVIPPSSVASYSGFDELSEVSATVPRSPVMDMPEPSRPMREAAAYEDYGRQGTAHNAYASGPSPFAADPVSVRQASFQPLGGASAHQNMPTGMDLIMDVPLRVTVELGRTRMQIRDVLDLGKGSVVELDKLVGEPVDMLVNGKLIAKGEVVVIDENFGIRVTDIVSPIERFNNLKIT